MKPIEANNPQPGVGAVGLIPTDNSAQSILQFSGAWVHGAAMAKSAEA